ncbi:hypothetical protein D3C73_845180 [compost metagenome]
MGEGSEDQQGRADHHRVHANIKEQRAGHVNVPQQWQREMPGVGGQERVTHRHRTQARDRGEQQAGAHPAQRPQAHLRLDPLGAGDHVLQDERHRHHQPRDEAAAGLVVAAHEQVDRHHEGNRQQQAHQHRRHHHEAQRGVAGLTRVDQVGDHVGRQQALLGRQLQAFFGRAEAAQQGKDGQRHGHQHGDLAEGIETTEVHQHDVDHIAAAAFWQGTTQVERGNVVRRLASQHGVGQQRHATTDHDRQQQVAQTTNARPAQAARQRRHLFDPPWQPAQAQQDQHRGDHFNHQLCQGQVRCGEPHESDASHQPAHADHGQGREPVILGLPRGAQGTGNRQQPQGHEHDGAGDLRPVSPAQLAVQHRDQPGQHGHQHHQEQLALQALGADPPFQATGQAHLDHQAALEQAFAVEPADDRRVFEATVPELVAQQQVEHDAAGHGDQAHDHRRVQAVPDCQAVLGQGAADDGQGGGGQQRTDDLGRKDPDDQAGEHQQFHRCAHPAWRFVRGVRQVGGGGAEEHVHGEPQRIGDAEHPGDGRDDGQ